jgi:hypothetical protein
MHNSPDDKRKVLVAAFANFADLPLDRDCPEFAAIGGFAAMLRDLRKQTDASLEFTIVSAKGRLAEWYLRDRDTGRLLGRAIFRPDGSTKLCTVDESLTGECRKR